MNWSTTPWDLGSELHYQSYARLIAVADKYIDSANIDWVLDYGSGVGTFTRALKDAYPHIKSIGVDFDRARTAANKRFGANLFDHYYEMNAQVTEYDLLRDGLPDLDINRLCICFINSTYYVFTEQRRGKRIEHLSRLISRFEERAKAESLRYMLATANNTDRAAVDAINK
jgi:SAM-dependent methyltransferase